MKLNQKIAVAVIAASAGILGMSSAALADSSINRNTGVVKSTDGNTAASIQVKNFEGGAPEFVNVNAATGAGAAVVTGSLQENQHGFTMNGTASGSDNGGGVKVELNGDDNDANQDTNSNVRIGL